MSRKKRREEGAAAPAVFVFIGMLSALVGLAAGGAFSGVGFSTVSEGNMIVIPLDGTEYNVLGAKITSDPDKLVFYVDGEPIYNGEKKKGVWLARQSDKDGLFIFSGVRGFTTVGKVDSSLTPPEKVWTSLPSPTSQDAFYLHARGAWDDGDRYASLFMILEDSDGNLVKRGSTVARKRYEGATYDTSRRGVKGNIDVITQQDTLYNQFRVSGLAPGRYVVTFQEAYQGVTSPGKEYRFAVEAPVKKDTTPPEIESFFAEPTTIDASEGDIQISFTAYFDDPESGISRSYIRWRTETGPIKYSIDSGDPELVSSRFFPCGPTKVKLYVVNGAKLTSTDTVTITKTGCGGGEDTGQEQDNNDVADNADAGSQEPGNADSGNAEGGGTGADDGADEDAGDVGSDNGLNDASQGVDWAKAGLVGAGVFVILSGAFFALGGRRE